MRTITLEELLEAGCHFGHQVTRQNPKARDFVFEARDNIHIIDLGKTKEELELAAQFVKSVAQKNGTMVLLGAKRQAADIVKEEVKRAGQEGADGLYFVTNRWIGGIFTNFPEMLKNFKKLKTLSERLNNPEEKARYTKKEISLWDKERAKLESFYGGIATMTRIPDAIFIIDTHLENLAVREARAMGVKTVGITDTNSDPTIINYPIPANDDAVGSIKLITNYIIDAWIEGRKGANGEEQRAEGKKEVTKKETKEKSPVEQVAEVKDEVIEKLLDTDDHAEKETELTKDVHTPDQAVGKSPSKKTLKKTTVKNTKKKE